MEASCKMAIGPSFQIHKIVTFIILLTSIYKKWNLFLFITHPCFFHLGMGQGSGGRGASSRLFHEEISALGCQANRPGPQALANADEEIGVGDEVKRKLCVEALCL